MRIIVARDAVLVAHMSHMRIHAIGNAHTRDSRHIAAEPIEIRLRFVALYARRAVDEKHNPNIYKGARSIVLLSAEGVK